MKYFLLLLLAVAAHGQAQAFDHSHQARLSFLDYDWSLNDSRSSSPR